MLCLFLGTHFARFKRVCPVFAWNFRIRKINFISRTFWRFAKRNDNHHDFHIFSVFTVETYTLWDLQPETVNKCEVCFWTDEQMLLIFVFLLFFYTYILVYK